MSCKSSSSHSSKGRNIDLNESSVSGSLLNESQRSQRSQQIFKKKITDNGDSKIFKKMRTDNGETQKQQQCSKKAQKIQQLNPDELKPRLTSVIKQKTKLQQKFNSINVQLKQQIANLKARNLQLLQQSQQLKKGTTSRLPYTFSYENLNIRTILPLAVGVFLIILICGFAMSQSGEVDGLKLMLDPKQNEKKINNYMKILFSKRGDQYQYYVNQIYNSHKNWNSLSSYMMSFSKLMGSFPEYEGYYMVISKQNLRMKQFIKSNWNHLGAIMWEKNNFGDSDWRLFIENAYLYRNIQVLSITQNNIKTIKKGDLQNFKYLTYVQFEGNPLTQQSENILLEFFKEKKFNIG